MLFKDHHLPMIRSGSKTVTRREWADNYPGPNVGTIVAAKTELLKPDDECDCFVKITGKRREPLGETTDESARREGDYEDVEDFRQGYEEVYGEGSWDPEKVVDVIEFEYVGDERPPASDTEQSDLGRVRCWDNEDCPSDGCEGELQQQDRINVMCLSCDEVFAHYKNDDNHILADSSDETLARKARMLPDGGTDEDAGRILHLFADTGIEDEVLHTFGDVTRVGIDPEPNPFSTVVQADACDPPITGEFDLVVCHPKCQRWSVATLGGGTDPEDHPDQIPAAREACERLGEHYIIENVPDAPLRDPVVLTGGMFGLPIHYPRAFETSFPVDRPRPVSRWSPDVGPLAEQDETGNAWVGWRLAKGYGHNWPARGLKRHAVPAPYMRRLLYWWLAARDGDTRAEQATIGEVDTRV